ncbi:YdcF family protein [Neorhizobium galegae]|uniref:YdcF family protein n=1 Tax=Neorhizobium galegae TaxID=399 RepID=UPI002107BD72|nr:YdcF family protein [Neorhizobium galegae]MCQ1834908.1 YdcF family protein [Neorhizobium galegae]UIY29656.1 YdcF family protein [Neorhizobium galegae]
MFLLYKLFWVFAQPLSIAFLLAALATFLVFVGRRRLGGSAAFLTALVLLLTLFTTTGTVALQVLEDRFPKPSREPQAVSCMIVLGGVLENEVTTARGGIELNQAADRFMEALRLARNHQESRILISGGDGSISGTYEGEAQASERFFSAFGIPADRLVKENASRTTYENTLNTAGLLKAQGIENCLLITSAFHMPRSMGLFRAAGITVTPWPVDYRTSGIVRLSLDFTQPALNAQLATTAAREWMSLTAYYLTGRIGGIFPG